MNEFLLGPMGGMFALGFAMGAGGGYGFAVRVLSKTMIEAQTGPLKVQVTHLEAEVARLKADNEKLHETINTLFGRLLGREDAGAR